MNRNQELENQSSVLSQHNPTRRMEFAVPAVNIHRRANEFLLEVDVPGTEKKDVDLTVEEGKLTITAHRAKNPREGMRLLHQEIERLDYRRVFDLDPSVDPEKITAQMDQGLLRVELHKAETYKPRKISIG